MNIRTIFKQKHIFLEAMSFRNIIFPHGLSCSGLISSLGKHLNLVFLVHLQFQNKLIVVMLNLKIIGKSIEFIINLQSILCHQPISTIKLLSKFHDRFLKIYDRQNNLIILYAKNHNVYTPLCVLISEITILSNT